jgi:hypothetical protein
MVVLALLLGAAALVGWQLGNADETAATAASWSRCPKLDGRTQREAEALLAELQIRPGQHQGRRVLHEDVPKDEVYDQSPRPPTARPGHRQGAARRLQGQGPRQGARRSPA